MGAGCQIPSTRRITYRNSNIVDKQLITGAHSLEHQPSHRRRLAAHRKGQWWSGRRFPDQLKRNRLIVGESNGLATGNVPLQICFDAVCRSRRKLQGAVWGNAFAAVYFDLRAGRGAGNSQDRNVRPGCQPAQDTGNHQQERNRRGNQQQSARPGLRTLCDLELPLLDLLLFLCLPLNRFPCRRQQLSQLLLAWPLLAGNFKQGAGLRKAAALEKICSFINRRLNRSSLRARLKLRLMLRRDLLSVLQEQRL